MLAERHDYSLFWQLFWYNGVVKRKAYEGKTTDT